jgi:hypothetical protein
MIDGIEQDWKKWRRAVKHATAETVGV